MCEGGENKLRIYYIYNSPDRVALVVAGAPLRFPVLVLVLLKLPEEVRFFPDDNEEVETLAPTVIDAPVLFATLGDIGMSPQQFSAASRKRTLDDFNNNSRRSLLVESRFFSAK